MNGERIYRYELEVTGISEYGLGFSDAISWAVAIPPQGARFDVAFAGRCEGRLTGTVTGTDFAVMWADGRVDLDIKARIETDDGAAIALMAGGIGQLRSDAPIVDLAENVTLSTADDAYGWVNGRQIWAPGTVDLAAGRIVIEGYMQ